MSPARRLAHGQRAVDDEVKHLPRAALPGVRKVEAQSIRGPVVAQEPFVEAADLDVIDDGDAHSRARGTKPLTDVARQRDDCSLVGRRIREMLRDLDGRRRHSRLRLNHFRYARLSRTPRGHNLVGRRGIRDPAVIVGGQRLRHAGLDAA